MTYPGSTTENASPPMTQQAADKATEVKDQVAEKATDARERASDAVDAGRHGVAEVAQTTADKARQVTDEAAREARNLVNEARNQVSQQAGDQHQKLVQSLRALSDELDSMTRNNPQSGGLATELVSQAHQHTRSVADWLDSRQPGDLIDEARRFARNRPGTFLLGAAVAGVLAGRVTRGAVAVQQNSSDSSTSPAPSSGIESEPTTVIPTVAPAYSTPPVNQPTAFPEPSSTDVGYHSTGDHGNGAPGPGDYYSGGAS